MESPARPQSEPAPSQERAPAPPARSSPIAWFVLIGGTLLGLAGDLVSKWAAFRSIAGAPVEVRRDEVLAVLGMGESLTRLLVPSHAPVRVVPGLLELTLVLNPGAVFGIASGQRWLFVGFTLIALGAGLWAFCCWTSARDRSAHLGIALMLAGALGNLYDRLMYACVRDFLHPLPGMVFPFGWRNPLSGSREVWPYVSNIADLWLIVGIVLLMAFAWRKGGTPTPRVEPGASGNRDEGVAGTQPEPPAQ